ncbi:hypothetical protein DDR33_24815 [Pararcticibacter amylolyticus]|uniref:Uncharacterized protein n=1 Tax=Pararcticibacter amylolyticus TaxID=2173175 RepID=A0A2U2P996_9SPHI|nr:hypothetical protein DDR33_24815 [Pararcticibacter amylolyticus]
MRWYYYLNFRVYKFYQKKKDSIPVFYAFLVTSTLLCLNVFILLGGLGLFMPLFQQLVNLKVMLTTYALIGFLNYLFLYRAHLYEEVFGEFEHDAVRYNMRSWDISVKLYIIVSISLFLLLLVIADLKNHGHL